MKEQAPAEFVVLSTLRERFAGLRDAIAAKQALPERHRNERAAAKQVLRDTQVAAAQVVPRDARLAAFRAGEQYAAELARAREIRAAAKQVRDSIIAHQTDMVTPPDATADDYGLVALGVAAIATLGAGGDDTDLFTD
jgi:hypothetical protein